MGSHPTPTSLREKARIQEQELLSKYPGFQSYKDCIKRAYGWGFASFAIAFSSSYFSLKVVSRRLPLDGTHFIVISSLVGSLAAYHFTKERSRLCHERFLIDEGLKVEKNDVAHSESELLKS